MVGVTGVTVKHSSSELSEADGTPSVVDVKLPRQQYRPADVIVADAETIGCEVPWLTAIGLPTEVPSEEHVPVAMGPHSRKATEPFQLEMPFTTMVALSVTDTDPDPIETDPPFPALGVVTIVVSQDPKPPRTKSLRVAVVAVDERVSDATDAKHRSASPRADRLIPPS